MSNEVGNYRDPAAAFAIFVRACMRALVCTLVCSMRACVRVTRACAFVLWCVDMCEPVCIFADRQLTCPHCRYILCHSRSDLFFFRQIKKLFATLDSDGNGSISYAELMQ